MTNDADIRRDAYRELVGATRAAAQLSRAARRYQECLARLTKVLFPDRRGLELPDYESSTSIELGAWIRETRIGLGMSQRDVAAIAELFEPAVSMYETGRQKPSRTTWERLVRALEQGGA